MVVAAGDVGLVLGAFYLAFWVRYGGDIPTYNFSAFVQLAPVSALVAVLLFFIVGAGFQFLLLAGWRYGAWCLNRTLHGGSGLWCSVTTVTCTPF